MLLLDVNVCLAAMRPDASTDAARVREWLTVRLVGHEQVGLVESVLASMVRIATHPRVFTSPSTGAEGVAFADALIAAPAAAVVRPGPRHWGVFADLVTTHRLRGNDVPDAYLAALALESGASFVSRDRGFARFEGLRLVDPLA